MESNEVQKIKEILMEKSKEELVDMVYWSMTIPQCKKLLETWKCPINRVSKECGYCLQDGWQHCGYVKVWKHRKQVSTSSPYEPLTINSPVTAEVAKDI